MAPLTTNRTLLALVSCLVVSGANAQESLTIGTIDFYGLQTMSEEEVRAALPFAEGDPVSREIPFAEIELAMAETLEVFRVELDPVCCSEPGIAILYVGLEEAPGPQMSYRPEPAGDAALPPEIGDTDRQIDSALWAAILAGNGEEDWSEGHAFSLNPAVRALQAKFVEYAEVYRSELIEVLHGSARQRALAAKVLGYAEDKRAIVPHLERAVSDPDEGVRNNATRALTLIAMYANQHPELGIEIRADIFLDMLNSIVLSDRQKASAVLWPLTQGRDPELLARIQDAALPSLIEMCNWSFEGHSFMPCIILERIVGLPEQDELHLKSTTVAMARELVRSQ